MRTFNTQEVEERNETCLQVLAGIIAQPALFGRALGRGLEIQHLGSLDDRAVFLAARELYEAGDPITVETVSLNVTANKRSGDETLERLESLARAVERWPGSSVLFEKALDHLLLAASKKALHDALGWAIPQILDTGSLDDIRDLAEELGQKARGAIAGAGPIPLPANVVAGKLAERVKTPHRKISTGIHKLDHVLGGGFDLGRMYSVIGRYKIGKTTFLTSVGYNIAYGAPDGERRKICMVSLERDQIDVEMLNAARALGINQRDLDRHFDRYEEAFERYRADPIRKNILYHHSPGADIDEVCAAIANAHRIDGIEVAFIDYYQVIFGPRGMRTVDHLSNVDRRLATLAADLGIVIVIAAQADNDGLPRDCKALLHSAAANFSIRRPVDEPDGWLENLASNFIETRDAGSPQDAAIRLVTTSGPYFEGI